jgi:hypothetical protein
VKKATILDEIKRTTAGNGGVPLGEVRFATETGITRRDWYGTYWARWGDAVREAGFEPNSFTAATAADVILEQYARYTVELGRLPTDAELRMKRKADASFPSWTTIAKLGSKVELVRQLQVFCQSRPMLGAVVGLCEQYLADNPATTVDDGAAEDATLGFVYLLRHGSRREYKIGRTYNPLRREGELGIQLPEKCQPVHYIQTDDPEGVEAYWHRRFADKRKEGEWFALTPQDVRAFKRWRRIY